MNLRDLEYVVAVAELRNFSQAAEQCHVSQPTLSGQIKKMEEWLGVQIFERTNKRVMLTEVGQQIIDSARRIIKEAEAIKEAADSARDPFSGKLRIGAFPTLSTYIFPELVPKIKAEMPNIKLILVEEKTATLLEMLKNGALDVALLALPVEDDYFRYVPLFEDAFCLAVPADHPLTQYDRVRQEQLRDYPLLLLEEGHCLRDQALEVCQLHQIAESQDFRATGLETLRLMVKAGTGITFMPKVAVREGEEDIRYIPFEAPAPSRTIGLVWRKTSPRTSVMEALQGMFR